jgi:integrase
MSSTHIVPITVRGRLGAAVEAGLIVTSPCTVKGAGQDQPREMRAATPAQVAEIVAAIPERYQALVLIAAWCGLRFGEITGLARRHVNMLHGTLTTTVNQTQGRPGVS